MNSEQVAASTPVTNSNGDFQCAVCGEYFERKEFFRHTKEHPQGMQHSDTFRKMQEKLKKSKEEQWTFFDDSLDERSALDPPLEQSKRHPLELTEEDRFLTRVSDWSDGYKAYERKKRKKLKEEQWQHLSQPLKKKDEAESPSSSNTTPTTTFDDSTMSSTTFGTDSAIRTPSTAMYSTGLQSPLFSATAGSIDSPHLRHRLSSSSPVASRSSLSSSAFVVHQPNTSKRQTSSLSPTTPSSPNQMRSVPQTNGKKWLKEKRQKEVMKQPEESQYKARAFPLDQSVGDVETVHTGTTFRGESAVLIREKDLLFVKNERIAFIPLPSLKKYHPRMKHDMIATKHVTDSHSRSLKPTSIPPMTHIVYGEGGDFYLWNAYIGDRAYVLRFNILGNKWKRIGPIPMPTSMNMHAVRGTRLLYHRGYHALLMVMGSLRGIVAGLSNNIYICYLDQPQLKWRTIAPFGRGGRQRPLSSASTVTGISTTSTRVIKPSKRANHSAVWWKSHNIIVFGGETKNKAGDVELCNDCWSFSLLQNRWARIVTTGDVPPPCAFHACCCTGDTMFISGGKPLNNQIYILDLKKKFWSRSQIVPPVPRPRFNHTLLVLESKTTSAATFIFAGGSTEGGGVGEKQLHDMHLLCMQRVRTSSSTLFSSRQDIDTFYDVNVLSIMSDQSPKLNSQKKQSIYDVRPVETNVLNKSLFEPVSTKRTAHANVKTDNRCKTPDAFVFENGSLLISPQDSLQKHVVARSVPNSRRASRSSSPTMGGGPKRRPSSARPKGSTRIIRSSPSGRHSARSKRSRKRSARRRPSEVHLDLAKSVYGNSGAMSSTSSRRTSSSRRRSSASRMGISAAPKRQFVAVENIDAPIRRRNSEHSHVYSKNGSRPNSRPSSGRRRKSAPKNAKKETQKDLTEDLLTGSSKTVMDYLNSRVDSLRASLDGVQPDQHHRKRWSSSHEENEI